MSEPIGEPTYEAGEIDRRDTEHEPHLNSRLGEAGESATDPLAGDPPADGETLQRQEDEGGRTDPA
ncbi:hypothetical protein [Litorihabitans aurantiacus]|uniref:Uncharacterized protein n=1 Tax=Litorihabitans aurantiacus TaxID=1930061 RepID=A0AA37XGU8_9MICO|nr:hypothetical protein [Litorihabitans aurantiacus]GMA32736.1 hypothetical protein GCM10025875_27280 [Litorihabitans aurantiacus]